MLNILLAYLICVPAAILCFLPVREKLKFGLGRTIAILAPAFCVFAAFAVYLTWRLGLGQNDLLIPLLLLSFAGYCFCLNVPVIRSLAVYLTVLALLSIITNFAACFDAVLNPDSGVGTFSLEFSLFQMGISLLATVLLAYPFVKYGKHLVDQTVSLHVCYGSILFSTAVIIANIATFPIVYHLYREEQSISGVLIIISSELVIWFLMQFNLNSAFSSSQTISKMRERNRILELQESQFRSQQKYIRDSARTRHDFRQNILTLAELYREGDMDAVGQYLDQYIEAMPKSEVSTFCDNTALNALLNYYVHVASRNQIDLTLRVRLTGAIPVSDVDLCSIVGNILENAVAACQESDEKKIQLTILTEDFSQLYIVGVNSFDGTVRQRDGKYLSTKQSREGIGLSSIESTAESYGGVAQFSHEGKRFFSNIAIPLK